MTYNSTQHVIASIIHARKEKNLTQTELGKRLGLPQSYISKLESGRLDIRLSNIIEIARFLNLELILVPSSLAPTVQSLTNTEQANRDEKQFYTLDDLDQE
jgi:transcriptional regulator with XRE-family HTH domain